MGFISNLFSSNPEGKIAKHLKSIKNPKAIKESRWEAIDYFKGLDDPAVAVPSLLQRFEFSLEHGINDTREKEACMEGILKHKDKALVPVREHLKSTTRIAWPIKALIKLADEATVVAALEDALNFEDVAFDQAMVDKNYDILCYLRDYKFAGFAGKLAHFLKDPDERVRFAVTEVLIEQDDSEIPEMLEPFLADLSAENLRIRQAAVEAFVKRKWPVKNPAVLTDGLSQIGLSVSKSGVLEAR